MSSATGLCSASSSRQSIEPLENSVQFKSGAVYTGSVKKGSRTRCGQGTFSWPSGLQYTGEFWNNKRQGTGLQVWPDGAKYEGRFEDDMRHGHGRHCWKNGEVYEGDYVCDKKHGHGRYSWPSGAYFCGYFECDLREGSGVYVSPEGEKFEGVYHDDIRDGEGVLTYPGGRQDVGIWRGTKLIRLRFTIADALYNPYSSSNPLAPLDSSLGASDHKSRGKFGPKGPLEMVSEELIEAAALGDEARVDAILKAGAVHVDVVDKLGHSALLAAAIHSHPTVIHQLLDNGADVNLLDDYGISALNACYHILFANVPQVDSLLSQLPSLKAFPVISSCSSPTTFTERTLHTCDLFSTTPCLKDHSYLPHHYSFSSSPLVKDTQRRRLQHYLTTTSSLSPHRAALQRTHKIRWLSKEEKEMIKSKSLGTLTIGNHQLGTQLTIQQDLQQSGSAGHWKRELVDVPVKQTRSYPLLASLTSELDEKKVRFTPLINSPRPEPEAKVQSGDDKSVHNLTTQHEGEKNKPIPSIATTVTMFPLTAMADPPLLSSSSTPQREIESENRLSASLDFGSILNADQFPPTASAMAGGEDILGVSALSGDYYSTSVDQGDGEREGRLSMLSQQSNVLPEEFGSDSMTETEFNIHVSGGVSQYNSPLGRSTPAINASSSHSIRSQPQHSSSRIHHTTPSPIGKSKKLPPSSIHDSPEQHIRRCSLLSSSQYGSIVSAAQSTSISCIGSEQMDSVASESPPPPSTSFPLAGRELVPLYTPRDSISVLLQRGADPNLSSVPLPPLFYTIRAGDVEAVETLLQGGANTEICLPLEVGGQYPLHTAMTCLHSSSSVAIVKALLDHGANPNCEEGVPPVKFTENGLSVRRREEEEEQEGERLNSLGKGHGALNRVTFLVGAEDSTECEVQDGHSVFTGTTAQAPAAAAAVVDVLAGDNVGRPGYTPLHLLCYTETTSTTGSTPAPPTQQLVATLLLDMVKILLAEGAEVNSVARGHSPLSLAILNSHNQIVDVLLEGGADPNLPLGRGVANALCVLTTHPALRKRDLPTSLALVSKLMKYGADVLQSVKITDRGDPGTVADFAHTAFKLDKRLACLKYHSLTKSERSRYRAAKKLQQHFTSIFKCIALQTIAAKEESWQNMHKKECHPCTSSVDLPCIVRQKLYRTTSMNDSCKPFASRKRHRDKGRPIVSAGGRPRTGPGMLSISLPEHTLRAALENVSKAHDGGKRDEGDGESGSEEEEGDRRANKGLKNNSNSSPGQNVMKISEMFERAKVLLPNVRCECTCVDKQDDGIAMDGLEAAAGGEITCRVGRKEWTIFSFCYECGRTSGIHLVKCPGCRGVSYCSRTCRSDNWKKGHQRECTGAQVKQKDAGSSPTKGRSIQRTKVTKRANSNTT